MHPAKDAAEQPHIGGTSIPSSGKLFNMLNDIYKKSEFECNIDVSFNHNDTGAQQNDCRDLLTQHIASPTVETGRLIAERLQSFTTNRSGLGLLFLITGNESKNHKLLISRFPADNGILAEEDKDSLNVEFLEKVFMKSATSYKAVLYSGQSLTSDFWDGRAIDKQISHDILKISNYWIKDFLASDFKTTPAAGTRRLADSLLKAMRQADDQDIKEEIVAASRLASNLGGIPTSINDFTSKYGFSDKTKDLIKKQLNNDQLFNEKFTFSGQEFKKHIAFQSIELDNGGILMADAQNFDSIFKREEINGDKNRFTTEGRVIDQKLKRNRSVVYRND